MGVTPNIMAGRKAPVLAVRGRRTVNQPHLQQRPFAGLLGQLRAAEGEFCKDCGGERGTSVHAVTHPAMRDRETHVYRRA